MMNVKDDGYTVQKKKGLTYWSLVVLKTSEQIKGMQYMKKACFFKLP